MTKWLTVALLLGAVPAVSVAQAPPGPPARADVADLIAGVVAAGAITVSILPEGDLTGELRWAAWTEAQPNGWQTTAALLRRSGPAVTVVWRVERADAYDPVLAISPWQYRDQPILLLQFQYGAAYTRVELFGLAQTDQPVMLDGIEGALIDLVPGDDHAVLRVFESSDLKGPPRCLAWDPAQAKLAPSAC